MTILFRECTDPNAVYKPYSKDEGPAITLCLSILSEMKKNKIVPPEHMTLPVQIENAIKNGSIKVKLLPWQESQTPRGYYDSLENTLVIFNNSEEINSSIILRSAFAHELFHAYEDLKQMPLKTTSAIEGDALLLQIKYLLYSLKLNNKSNTLVADELINYGVINNCWFANMGDNELKILIKAASGYDKKEWKFASRMAGEFYVNAQAYNEVQRGLMRAGAGITQAKAFEIEISKNNPIIISKDELVTLAIKSKNKRLATNIRSKRIANVEEMDYWIKVICAKHPKQISIFDQNTLGFDGIKN